MAKAATGPFGTPGVTGSIGPVTFSQGQQGQTVIKTKPVPSNPQSASQTGNRSMFAFISQQWAGLSEAEQETYDDAAAANSLQPFAQYAKDNNRRWQQSKAPSKARTAAETETPAVPTITANAGDSETPNTLEISVTATSTDWGVAVYYKADSAPAGARNQCIAVRELAVGANSIIVEHDGELDGYYGVRVFTSDGVIGTIVSDQAE